MRTEQYNIKIINTITSLMLLFIPLSMVLNFINERYSFAILYFFFFFATLKHYSCFKKEQDISKASEQILLIFFGLYFAFYFIGEQKSFDVLWGLAIPMIAVLTATLDRLKVWLISTIVLAAVMIAAASIFPEYIRYEIFPLFSLLWALIFTSYMAYSYKSIHTKLEAKISSYQDSLEEQIEEGLKEINTLNQNLDETQIEILDKLGTLGEYRFKGAQEQSSRIGAYTKELALLAGVDEESAKLYERAAPLHDIGQVGIPDSILNKPGRLTSQEYEMMKEHVIVGQKILSGSNKPLLQIAAQIAGEHHEKYDGTGYPKGINGTQIALSARIVAIVDVFDAVYGQSTYKNNWTNEEIISYYKEEKGKHFDPELAELFLENIELFIKIYDESIRSDR